CVRGEVVSATRSREPQDVW
nr:immunoglobulin heavy chain junction region [Macaca mulatta]MOV57323.1 immunoglobulin heavy chain junction region [Macaca mulatta]